MSQQIQSKQYVSRCNKCLLTSRLMSLKTKISVICCLVCQSLLRFSLLLIYQHNVPSFPIPQLKSIFSYVNIFHCWQSTATARTFFFASRAHFPFGFNSLYASAYDSIGASCRETSFFVDAAYAPCMLDNCSFYSL